MIAINHPIALIAVFIWIGFVGAISFMEAWLKFRAPGVTLPIGLGIGRLIFKALNKIEWVLATAIISTLLFNKVIFITFHNILFFIPLIVLIFQSIWALPKLNAKAELHIQGQTVSVSNLHYYYIGLETVKVACLTTYGITLFNKI